jgi:hypothetical protein
MQSRNTLQDINKNKNGQRWCKGGTAIGGSHAQALFAFAFASFDSHSSTAAREGGIGRGADQTEDMVHDTFVFEEKRHATREHKSAGSQIRTPMQPSKVKIHSSSRLEWGRSRKAKSDSVPSLPPSLSLRNPIMVEQETR